MTYKFGSKIEDVEDRLNEFLEFVRRYDEANGTDPVPDQVKKACMISNTTEPLKTHLQLNVGNLGNFNALRVATEDYLRSRRIFRTTSAGNTHDEGPVEVDAVSWRGKGKGKSSKGKKGGKKGKESHSDKGYGETTTEHSRFEGECRNCGKYGHKAAVCWYKQPPKTSKATAVNKSKKLGHQTRLYRHQVSRLDSQMRDSGYSRWKTARIVTPMSVHPGLHRNSQW